MLRVDPGETFLRNLINEQSDEPRFTENRDTGEDDIPDDDFSLFSTQTLADEQEKTIPESDPQRPNDEGAPNFASRADQNGHLSSPPLPEITLQHPNPNIADNDVIMAPRPYSPPHESTIIQHPEDPTIPKGRSIAHHHIMDNKLVFVSFDIETGGEYCGILQLSAEIVRIKIIQSTSKKGVTIGKDSAGTIDRVSSTFNSYVKPPEGAIFADRATAIHGLHENHNKIRDADNIATVWARFCQWLSSNLLQDEKVCLMAYNGETCDLKWLWKMTQAPRSPLDLPESVVYFLDPLRVIKHYGSCPLNQKKSKLDSLELGCIWSYIHNNQNLNGAHDSLVDVRAQTDILLHKFFVPFINRTPSIQPIDLIFSKTQQNQMKRDMEPIRPVHPPWQELSAEDDVVWHPTGDDLYTGSQGGPNSGPSALMKQLASSAESLVTMFLFIVPLSFFEKVAVFTDKYCYRDWVVEQFGKDRDGETKKVRHFVDVPAKVGRNPYPKRRHRADKERKKYDITPGFVICWIALLILQGAHFGTYKPSAANLWRGAPYGIGTPIYRNTMTREAYQFMRRYIHFCDNSKKKSKGTRGFDPLFKVRYPLDVMMKGMRLAWTAGMHVTIDESMIRYMGRAVSYVQYMPAKPIKHGIKVFCLCCAVSAVLLSFKVYVGKDEDEDGSAVKICDDLVHNAEITNARGRVLYTDNYYTSVKLVKHMFIKYGWSVVGTIVPTDKKSRQDEDIPFLKLSNGARNSVKRGWFREAVLKLKTPTGKIYYIQCTTWRDKKQVCFLSSKEAGFSTGLSVKRHVRGKKDREIIDRPRAQLEYVKYFNAVDRNDRDSADYSTTIRTIRYYIRIFCWGLDRVVHTLYVVVVYCSALGIGPPHWNRYRNNKNSGRYDFQIDLGIDLLNYGIGLDWTSDDRPSYMRSGNFIPCNCNKCFFCLHGYTNGIDHSRKRKVVIEHKCGTRATTDKCTSERVDLGQTGSDYCRMCYRKQKKGLKFNEKRKLCNNARLGCAVCKEPVCDECWDLGYDLHNKD